MYMSTETAPTPMNEELISRTPLTLINMNENISAVQEAVYEEG